MSEMWKKHIIAKQAYEHGKHDPAKRALWKDLESKLTNLAGKKRNDLRQGKSNAIVNQEDICSLVKFAKNGAMKEIALVKDSQGRLAKSPEESLENLCDAHFRRSKAINKRDIERDVYNSHIRLGKKEYKTHTWINLQRLRKALDTFG